MSGNHQLQIAFIEKMKKKFGFKNRRVKDLIAIIRAIDLIEFNRGKATYQVYIMN